MEHFYKALSKKEQTFLDDLFNSYVTITEKIDGNAFSAEWSGDEWIFYKRNAKNPINVLDRTMMKTYEPLIDFFEEKPTSVTSKLQAGLRFEMEHVSTLKPNLIGYDRLPQNNLILHSVSLYNNGKLQNKIEDTKELQKYAKILDVSPVPIIFQGKLNSKQIEELETFLKTPREDLVERFKTESFTRYIFSVLDPKQTKTYLQDNLDSSIEGIVFYFNDKVFLAKLVDPTFEETVLDKKSNNAAMDESEELRNLFLTDFFGFVLDSNLSKYSKIKSKNFKAYIEIVSDLFVEFCKKYDVKKYSGIFDKQIDVFKGGEFDINPRFLDDDIKKIINKNKDLETCFKIALSGLRYNKKRFSKDDHPLNKEAINAISLYVNESKLLLESFSEYFLRKELSEYLKEDLEYSVGKKRINVIIGKFQPFTLGHQKMIDALYKKNGLPVYILSVRRKDPIISEKLTEDIFKELVKQDEKIEGFQFMKRGLIFDAFSVLRPDYEPVMFGCGEDRGNDYSKQVNSIRSKWDVFDPELGIEVIPRTDEDISATKVRQAIIDDEVDVFESMTPKAVHKFYKNLQKELG